MNIARHWRLREQRYHLTGTVCTRCGKVNFTPRPVCTECSAPLAEIDARFAERRLSRPAVIAEPAQR